MIPMFDKKKAVSIIVGHDKPMNEDMGGDDDDHEKIFHEMASELMNAVHEKDSQGVASAFKAMFQALEMMPHEENDEEE